VDKLSLLKKLHEIVWRDDDLMEQETLYELQELIDRELQQEESDGYIVLDRLPNGYIKGIIDMPESS